MWFSSGKHEWEGGCRPCGGFGIFARSIKSIGKVQILLVFGVGSRVDVECHVDVSSILVEWRGAKTSFFGAFFLPVPCCTIEYLNEVPTVVVASKRLKLKASFRPCLGRL